jgi:GTP cyclohydrolase I
MIIVDGIEFNSHCIHHLSPFFGHAHIAYVPNKKIVGLSKIPKTVDMFANRLQVQEVLTTQIADAINSVLEPKGVAVVLEGHHTCCSTRGAKKKARMITSSMRGVFMENISTRNEFLSLIKMR